MSNLAGKVAFVTGCGSLGGGWGNGKAIATLLARRGAVVYGVDMNSDAAEETKSVVSEDGGIITVRQCDVTIADKVAESVKECLEKYGRIDILVNNVGRSEPGGPAELSEEIWDDQLAVNLKSAYLMCHHVLPSMEAQGAGVIVNVASVAGLQYIGKPQVAYSAAKAGLMQMTKTTAVLYAPKGIRMNCVVPGLMHTPLVQRLADKYASGDYAGFVETRNKQVPMGRMGDAWDVAHAVLFLASDESRYVTGTSIVVDGGLTARTP
ncbi:SDR family NAD(P)-dependent oxidoreductase [Paraburkholderia tropica]|uniref:SDR family NAD(P)-dependent oxidoreductase n=1 Tax=Paraburkholderia tropica TaxID=92647 RepID=UPI001591E209|nr:SDR family NAD(P)-dependent oxidoreductase [Paraburkholderia tropica]